jgi:hypothetical protein
MQEKKRRLEMAGDRRRPRLQEKPKSVQEWLEKDIWPHVPEKERGKPLTKEEVEGILGFGPEGV